MLDWFKKYADRITAYTFRFLFVIAIISELLFGNLFEAFTALMGLELTFLPRIVARRSHIYLPSGYQAVFLLFIFGSLYLGELNSFYEKFWWWDLMLHSVSGILLGYLGFLLVYILNREEKINVFLSPFFIVFFSFLFAMGVGALWEIFEYTCDHFLHTNMQKTGLDDTMWDLIFDEVGALLFCTAGFVYLTNKQKSIVGRLLKEFVKLNKKFFDKRRK